MSYTPEQYQRAIESLKDPKLPEASRTIRTQRIKEYEDDQARGYKRAPDDKGFPTLDNADNGWGSSYLENSKSPTADTIRAVQTPEQMEARRKAVDWSKKLVTDPALKNASKLKVFNDPADYDPPPDLPGQGSLLPKAPLQYYEPTTKEFRAAITENPTLKSRLQEQYPDNDVEKLPDQYIEDSDAFKVYADARWQHALADALKQKQPITRVSFSDKTSYDDPSEMDESGRPKRKLKLAGHLANAMDGSMAVMTGALEGKSGGLYDLALSAGAPEHKSMAADLTGDVTVPASQGTKELRDAGRGSRERNPIGATAGEIAGALDPRGVPGLAFRGLSKGLGMLSKPSSLAGRVAMGATVGAGVAVLDENMRAAAKLASDALDAEASAREMALRVVGGLPGINPTTALAGAGLGAGADLIGAGAGAVERRLTQGDRLRAPLAHFEESGGKMGPLMGTKVSPEAEAYRGKAEAQRTTPQDLVVDEILDPMASQRLQEQEGALRGAEQATSVAQSRLDGVTLPVKDAVLKIRADVSSKPGATPAAASQQRAILKFTERLAQEKDLTADRLDQYLAEADEAAKLTSARSEPVEAWDNVSRHLRDLRDELRYRDEATIVTEPTDKGLFTADPDVTIAEPQARQIGGVRDKYGNVKPVEDYSAEKLRQSKLLKFHEDMNKRLGLPGELKAEPVLSEPVVDKGLFNVETPEEVVSKIPAKTKLTEDERRAFGSKMRQSSGRDYLRDRREMESLGERTDEGLEASGRGPMGIPKKLQTLRQLDDQDQLARAMGNAIDGLNSKGVVSSGLVEKLGIRSIPTLRSLSGGLPSKPGRTPVSPEAVGRLRRFLQEYMDINQDFIPTAGTAGLRGGKPARIIGAARSEQEAKESDFSPQEREFWLKVIDQIAKDNGGTPQANNSKSSASIGG
jgi:hypothetical protein